MRDVEAVVVGLGAMGSSVLRHLAARDVEAVGIERFDLGHPFGSSHGRSRVFRLAYPEGDYVRLARAARAAWTELEEAAGETLLTGCGMVAFAEPGNDDWSAVVDALEAAGEPYERLAPAEVTARFPELQIPERSEAFFDPSAGFTDAERTVRAQITAAAASGTEVVTGTVVETIDISRERPVVETASESYRCRRLVVSPGPWAADVLGDLDIPFTVTRQEWHEFVPAEPRRLGPDRVPVYADYDALYYGFPFHVGGLKAADDNLGPATTPAAVDRSPTDNCRDRLGEWVGGLFPEAAVEHAGGAVCLYTLTPDRDFVIGQHPGNGAVVVAGGFSGHGFKFTPLVGRMAVELAIDGASEFALDRFDPGRFAG